MAYRIEYDGCSKKYEVRQERHILPGILVLCGAVFLLTMCLRPEAAGWVRSFLIPGEDTLTVQAFSTMTNDLRSGAGIREAIEGFCRLVIHGP